MTRLTIHRAIESAGAPDWARRLGALYEERRGLVLGVAAGVLAVPLLLGWIMHARGASEREAEAALSRADQEFYGGSAAAAATFYQDVVERFEGTRAAAFANVGLGRVALVQGKPADALAAFAKALDAHDPLASRAARRGHAAALEDTGKPADAGHDYEDLTQTEKDGDAVGDLLSAARAYRAAGKVGNARACLERITKEFADSPHLGEAKAALGELD